jgi:hypothetical protein
MTGGLLTLYDSKTVLLSGYAKQSSLSRITALMVGLFLEASKAFSMGVGRSLKVDMVACGRHNEGFARSLKTFKDADRFKFILTDLAPVKEGNTRV